MSGISASSTGSTITQAPNVDASQDKFILRPYSVIVANLPDPTAKTYTPLGAYIRDYFRINVKHVISYQQIDKSSGHAIVHFDCSPAAYKVAMRLHNAFEKAAHGKLDFLFADHEGGPYLWLATTADDQWMTGYTKDYLPCIVPDEWTAEAIKDATTDRRNVYRAIRRFTVRFAYATLQQLER